MPFFVCNCVSLSSASFRVKGLLVFSHSPSRKKFSRKSYNLLLWYCRFSKEIELSANTSALW